MFRIGKEEIDAVARVIESKKLFRVNDSSNEVNNFEKEWAEKIGVKYTVCMSGGTGAIISALVGLGIGPGDEVIVPAYTFISTALAVLAVGAIPVIADIDGSLTIDPDDIERKISPYTKAILPVHMVGIPCNMDKIMDLAKNYNLKVVEDACQADGGSYKGKRLGAIGDAGAFSFNFYKIITAGEGGAVVTNNRRVYERIAIYHDVGLPFWNYVGSISEPLFIGSQFRASEITGAIMREQLKRLDGILEDLRKVKRQFVEKLSSMPKINFARSNDPEGDCASTLAFSFPNEASARKFAKSEGVGGWLPIDSDRHVYINWDPILNKQGAHHPALNPYNLPENKKLNMNYSKDMCKKTLEILSTTVFLSLNPDWSTEEVEYRINSCSKAAAGL